MAGWWYLAISILSEGCTDCAAVVADPSMHEGRFQVLEVAAPKPHLVARQYRLLHAANRTTTPVLSGLRGVEGYKACLQISHELLPVLVALFGPHLLLAHRQGQRSRLPQPRATHGPVMGLAWWQWGAGE